MFLFGKYQHGENVSNFGPMNTNKDHKTHIIIVHTQTCGFEAVSV